MTALRTLDHRWRAWWRYAETPYRRAYRRRWIGGGETPLTVFSRNRRDAQHQIRDILYVPWQVNHTGLSFVRACASESRIAGEKPVFTCQGAQALAIRDFAFMSYELTVVHPAVARWLTDHDYTYQHEVYMPDYGRADFVATHDNGHVLVVECKADCTGVTRAITQAADYRDQYNPKARIAVGVPQHTVTTKTEELLKRRKVQLIAVDVPPDRSSDSLLPLDPTSQQIMRLLDLADEWEAKPEQGIAYAINQYLSIGLELNAVFEVLIKWIDNAQYASTPSSIDGRWFSNPLIVLDKVYSIYERRKEPHRLIKSHVICVWGFFKLGIYLDASEVAEMKGDLCHNWTKIILGEDD